MIFAVFRLKIEAVDVDCTRFTMPRVNACKLPPGTDLTETDELNFILPKDYTVDKVIEIEFGNNVTFIPQQLITKLPHMKRLKFSKNKLERLLAGSFSAFVNLEQLFMTDNQIHTIHENAFAGLSKLTYLFLEKNQLTRIDRWTFANLPELTRLYLEENAIEEIEEGAFNLPKLTHLIIDDNKLKTLPNTLFAHPSALLFLGLKQNRLQQINNAVYNLDKLVQLSLSHNQITDLDLKKLAKMKNLRNLYMENTTFDLDTVTVSADEIASSKSKVNKLVLSHNKMRSGIIFQKLRLFPNLEELHLESNALTKMDLDVIRAEEGGFARLLFIEIGGNNLDEKWLNEKMEALSMRLNPGVRILTF